MRTPRSAAPVFAESRIVVFAPSAMAVKISNSIAVFRAALCWNALRVLKMSSGLGRLVAAEVAIVGLLSRRLEARNYTWDSLKTFLLAVSQLPGTHPAGILSSPRNSQEAIDETRISPLVLSPARHGARRSCLRTLGPAAPWFSDQRGRRVGARGPGHGRRARRFHRCRKNKTLHREFDQWPELLQPGRAPISPQLRPVRFRFLPA